MDYTLYLLGSGILDHPARWWIIGMVVSGIFLLSALCLMIWLSFSETATRQPFRDTKILVCFVVILALCSLLGFCQDRYYQEIQNNKTEAAQASWHFLQDGQGNIYVYDTPCIRHSYIHKKPVSSAKNIISSEITGVNSEEMLITSKETPISTENIGNNAPNIGVNHHFSRIKCAKRCVIPCLDVDNY